MTAGSIRLLIFVWMPAWQQSGRRTLQTVSVHRRVRLSQPHLKRCLSMLWWRSGGTSGKRSMVLRLPIWSLQILSGKISGGYGLKLRQQRFRKPIWTGNISGRSFITHMWMKLPTLLITGKICGKSGFMTTSTTAAGSWHTGKSL